jgi:uncharacterized protein (TIGR02266 family)
MGQETRKDPRAKVLTMTVRYKSATLDEFIEHHSHDVSRGGMFIKTPSPFPPGTLLKFEVKIAEDQKVIQGVGRVVWKRDGETGDKERPSGMGVKFIKIDDVSRKTIDALVDGRGNASAAYEAGGGDGGGASLKTTPAATPAAAMTPAVPDASGKAPVVRKATMIGLGAMGAHAAAAAAKAAESVPPPSVAKGGGMFPFSDSEADMPAPEDRTVMKQAAELLQDALREAGGSMDDVGTKTDAKKPAAPVPEPERKSRETEPDMTSEAKVEARAGDKGPHTLRSEPPKSDKKPQAQPASGRPAAANQRSADRAPSARPASARPASARPQPILSEPPPTSEGGGGRIMIILAGIAIAAGALFVVTKKEPTPPEPIAEPPAVVMPAPIAPPTPAVEEPKPAEAAPSAAPAVSASAAPALSAAPAPSAAAPVVTAPIVPAPVAKPVPVTPPAVVPPAAVAPKPVVNKPKPKPAESPAEPAPGDPKPAEPAPAPAAPKPKPADTSGDNPY